MPSRIIRESCRSSPTLARLSHGAERLFWRLTTVADDFGRFEASAMVIRADCFKMMLDRITLVQVRRWYDELVIGGLVRAYIVEGKEYGEFITWSRHQRVRAARSKYPSPSSADTCRQLLTNAPGNGNGVIERERETGTGTGTGTGTDDALTVTPTDFDVFWAAYPVKEGKGKALEQWRRLGVSGNVFDEILTGLNRWRASDRWARGFIAHPATWLHQRRWEDDPSPARAHQTGRSRENAATLDRFIGRHEAEA